MADDPSVEASAASLRDAIERLGAEKLIDRPALRRNVLGDLFSDSPRMVSLLAAAADDGVVRALHGQDPATAAVLVPRLARELSDAAALQPDAATWAVQVWAQALGIDTASEPSSPQTPPVPPTEPIPPRPAPTPPPAPAPAPAPTPAPTPQPEPAPQPRSTLPLPVSAARASTRSRAPIVVLLALGGLVVASATALAIAFGVGAFNQPAATLHPAAHAQVKAPAAPAATPTPTPTPTSTPTPTVATLTSANARPTTRSGARSNRRTTAATAMA